MLWLVSSLESAPSLEAAFPAPPPPCGFFFLPLQRQNFLKCPFQPQVHVLSFAGHSVLESLLRLLPQFGQQSGGTVILLRLFLYVEKEMAAAVCWLVSRIHWDLLAVSQTTASVTALLSVMLGSAKRSCWSSMSWTLLMNSPRMTGSL